jgi:hypothetical protein
VGLFAAGTLGGTPTTALRVEVELLRDVATEWGEVSACGHEWYPLIDLLDGVVLALDRIGGFDEFCEDLRWLTLIAYQRQIQVGRRP